MATGAFLHPNIAELLDAESEYARTTPALLNPFAPQLLEAFDVALAMYRTFGRAVGQSRAFDDRVKEFNACAKALGAADGPDLDRIRGAGAAEDARKQRLLDDLQAVEDRLHALVIRGVVYSELARAFACSVADLARMRMTTAVGLQRLVIEGYALLCLMRDDPAVALEWCNVRTDAQGRAFHGRHNRAIQAELQRVGLAPMYEKASGMALHARFSGATFGLSIESRREYSRGLLETMVGHQELRPENAFYFIVEAASILDAQAMLFPQLTSAFPDVDEPIWKNWRVPDFRRRVGELWQRFRSALPGEIADLEQKYGAAASVRSACLTRQSYAPGSGLP